MCVEEFNLIYASDNDRVKEIYELRSGGKKLFFASRSETIKHFMELLTP